MIDKTIRLTTAQALVKFLNQQYIDVDGEVTPFVEGVFWNFWAWKCFGVRRSIKD